MRDLDTGGGGGEFTPLGSTNQHFCLDQGTCCPFRLWNSVGVWVTFFPPESRCKRTLLLCPLVSRCMFTPKRHFQFEDKLRFTFWNRVSIFTGLEQGLVSSHSAAHPLSPSWGSESIVHWPSLFFSFQYPDNSKPCARSESIVHWPSLLFSFQCPDEVFRAGRDPRSAPDAEQSQTAETCVAGPKDSRQQREGCGQGRPRTEGGARPGLRPATRPDWREVSSPTPSGGWRMASYQAHFLWAFYGVDPTHPHGLLEVFCNHSGLALVAAQQQVKLVFVWLRPFAAAPQCMPRSCCPFAPKSRKYQQFKKVQNSPIRNLAFHSLLRWKMIFTLPFLTTSLIQLIIGSVNFTWV